MRAGSSRPGIRPTGTTISARRRMASGWNTGPLRRRGIGTALMDTITKAAAASGARMLVLETQSCNERAIAFYRKNGFSVIGFDLYAYSNRDPERHEVRVEMGKRLDQAGISG